VLDIILGPKQNNSKPSIAHGQTLEKVNFDDLDDLDFQDMSLEEFANDRSSDKRNSQISIREIQPAEYDKEKARFEELHKSITACDQVLKSVETFLTGFQADLGAVSSEIESLQSRSSSLNSKLENRRVVEKLLGPSVEELSLSPDLVKKISNGNIDEGWIRALADLDKRSKAIQAKAKEQRKIKALDDLLPILESLRNRVSDATFTLDEKY
jgi:septal ring factor EnvC (AmiA/AmiB activator)